jgi:methionine salvage enolase-phosphatase E1
MHVRCLTDVATKGVNIDKGFKVIHITKAAKAVTQLIGYEVSTTQVTNHLRKWKVKYQRIEILRMLSGALWDDDRKMILLEEQHYLGHTQVCNCSC